MSKFYTTGFSFLALQTTEDETEGKRQKLSLNSIQREHEWMVYDWICWNVNINAVNELKRCSTDANCWSVPSCFSLKNFFLLKVVIEVFGACDWIQFAMHMTRKKMPYTRRENIFEPTVTWRNSSIRERVHARIDFDWTYNSTTDGFCVVMWILCAERDLDSAYSHIILYQVEISAFYLLDIVH